MRTLLLLSMLCVIVCGYGQQSINNCILSLPGNNEIKIRHEWQAFSRLARINDGDTLVVPVVFHVIHQNGGENLPDAAVLQALNVLNEGFANAANFDQGSGVDTEIRFCLAKKDPDGNYSTGINHVYADLPKVIPEVHDAFLKSLINWDPTKYVNIWVVKEIQLIIENNSCNGEDLDAAGYATMPPSHGSQQDGIVVEAANLQAAIIHEMGHYLGLFHTFEGCLNNDCTQDGDQVCDTPPQSKMGANCAGTSNSCQTDANSGFSSDQFDLPNNFMDYTSCAHDFTQGQKERMRFMLEYVRNSLLQGNTCEPDCTQPAHSSFTFPDVNYKIGDPVHFTNNSTGAGSYEWRINNQVVSTMSEFDYVFPHQGWFKIELLSKSSASSACNHSQIAWIKVYCAIKPRISVNKIKVDLGETVFFTGNVTLLSGNNPVTYKWYADGVQFSTELSPAYQFMTPGKKVIYLVTQQGNCIDTSNLELVTVRPLPDYRLSISDFKCDSSGTRKLDFSICNDGSPAISPGLPISFYYQNPTQSAATLLKVYTTTTSVGANCCENFSFELPGDFDPAATRIYGVINDPGNLATPYSFGQFPVTPFLESNYSNNMDSVDVFGFQFSISPQNAQVLLGSTVSFTSSADNLYTIRWQTTTGQFDCNTCLSPQLVVNGYTRVIATARSASGCVASDTAYIAIYINQDIMVPSAFTPNDDSKNDIFYILGNLNVSRIRFMNVYNRWGLKVFENKNFSPNIPSSGWNGTYKGKPAIMDTYVYYFVAEFLDGSTKDYKGTVTLIR